MELHDLLGNSSIILADAIEAEQKDHLELSMTHMSKLRVFLNENLVIKPVDGKTIGEDAQRGIRTFYKVKP